MNIEKEIAHINRMWKIDRAACLIGIALCIGSLIWILADQYIR